MTKNELCKMCMEYSVENVCEHIDKCELLKILDENEGLKRKVEKLECEMSWRDFPESMGK